MGKYYLVTSFYNPMIKIYENEQKLEYYDRLANLDLFTSQHTKDELYHELKLAKSATISIKYLKSISSRPIYLRAIFSNQTIASCINSLEKKYFETKPNYDYAIKRNNYFFQTELDKLKQLIKEKNLPAINAMLPQGNKLGNLIRRYIQTNYDDNEQGEKRQDYNIIIEEFSRYTNFRKWIVNNIKLEEQALKDIKEGNLENYEITVFYSRGTPQRDYNNLTQEEYLRHLCNIHNTAYLDKDTEEFIETSELVEMGFCPEYYQPDSRNHQLRRVKNNFNPIIKRGES